jgi:Ca2+-binding RTX toxin-like protein
VRVTLAGATTAAVKIDGVAEDTVRNIENLKGGSEDDALVGDSLPNALFGLAGDDLLRGGAGNDVLDGGAGIDWADYSDKSATVKVTLDGAANAGVKVGGIVEDKVRNIEKVKGGSANDTLVGDGMANSFFGIGGDDFLNGKTGNDVLTGGLGEDRFVFDTELNGLTNVDTITDFNVADDSIRLENAIFTKLSTVGKLSAEAFHIGANAVSAGERIIYDSATGNLFYDSNGNAAGGKIQFAILDPGLALTNTNFLVA